MSQILDKLKKLLAHAESAKELKNLEEAATFMAKVEELMAEHNLSMLDVMQHAATQEEKAKFADFVTGEWVSYKDNLAGDRWRYELMKVLVDHNYCNFYFNRHLKSIKVYGRLENVETVVWLYNFLSVHLILLANESRKQSATTLCRHTYMKNFLIGAIVSINQKLESRVKSTREGELMRVTNNLLKEYINKQVPNMKVGGIEKQITVGEGYSEGKAAGAKVNFDARLKGNGNDKKLLS